MRSTHELKQEPSELMLGINAELITVGWKFRLTDWGTINTQFAVQLDGNLVSSGVMNPMVVLRWNNDSRNK